MKALSAVLSVMLLACVVANAANTHDGDEQSFRPTYSVEAGAGLAPIHLLLTSRNYSAGTHGAKAFVKEGKEYSSKRNPASNPSFSLSFAYRPFARWEFTVTAGFSWVNAELIQHPVFGTGPDGAPRYNWSKTASTEDYLMWSLSITPQARVFWNPNWKVKVYSGFGFGVIFFPDHGEFLPSLVLAGAKFGGKRVYFFAENTYSPFATMLHGGLGVRF